MVKQAKTELQDAFDDCDKIEFTKALTPKEIAKKKLDKIIEEEGKKLVKGRFRNYEVPGGSAEIQIRKYPEDKVPMFKKKMMDNEIYEIPLYVARHLNGTDICAEALGGKIHTCSYKVHGFSIKQDGSLADAQQDGAGVPVPIITDKYRKRYGFESLEFDGQ